MSTTNTLVGICQLSHLTARARGSGRSLSELGNEILQNKFLIGALRLEVIEVIGSSIRWRTPSFAGDSASRSLYITLREPASISLGADFVVDALVEEFCQYVRGALFAALVFRLHAGIAARISSRYDCHVYARHWRGAHGQVAAYCVICLHHVDNICLRRLSIVFVILQSSTNDTTFHRRTNLLHASPAFCGSPCLPDIAMDRQSCRRLTLHGADTAVGVRTRILLHPRTGQFSGQIVTSVILIVAFSYFIFLSFVCRFLFDAVMR